VAFKAEVEDSKIKIQHKIEENVRLSLDLKHLGEIYVKV
jgi:regulator of replication initiation timing